MKLAIGTGTAVEAKAGSVNVNGSTVELWEELTAEEGYLHEVLILAYCLRPGETVRRVAEGEYVVQF